MIEPFVFDPRAVAPAELLGRGLEWLDDEERARHARFTHAEAAHTWLAGRVALRGLLGERLGVAPSDVLLARRGQGRPCLRDGGPCFSLTHGPSFVVVTVGEGDHGVDAEPLARASALWSMPETIFSPAERAMLSTDEEAVLCWTLKEAYLKARGLGLTVDPRRLAFALGPPITLAIDPDMDDRVAWGFSRVSFPGHVGAVAHPSGEPVAEAALRRL